MEEGKARDSTGHTSESIAAAEHLLHVGWWNTSEREKKYLEPLLSAGLGVGVNLNYAKLGLRPALVMGDSRGGASLWDVSGGNSFALRSYFSSSLRRIMLAVPPLDFKSYRALWRSLELEGSVEGLRVYPLQDIRFLHAPIERFNEERKSFDFAWYDLPHRRYDEQDPDERALQVGPNNILVLNEIMKNPVTKNLGDISISTGVQLDACVEATKFIREYPLGWGFQGSIDPSHSGLVLLYTSLRDDIFGAVRAGIRNVPFAALEAWGLNSDGYVYLAELVIPGESLAETTEFIGKISSICDESFSYGFYETLQFQRHPLAIWPKANGEGVPLKR